MTQRYKLTTGPDGTVWLPLQPMILDLQEQMDKFSEQQHIVDKLYAVRTFLDALVFEAQRDAMFADKTLKECEKEASYKDTLE
jgi:hypothetical protein